MTTDERYQGWTNRETWALNLWLSNDQGLYEMLRERIGEAIAEHDTDQRENCTDCVQGSHAEDCGTDLDSLTRYDARSAGELVQAFWDEITDPEQMGTEGLSGEMLSMVREVGSVWRVDWDEIGAAWLSE